MSDPTPTPRFPPRGLPAGCVSQCYTPAEIRMISYVNEVVRGSDRPGTELLEAIERLPAIARYWQFKERAEIDERTLPIDNAPKPIAPAPQIAPGPGLCKSESPPDCCRETVAPSGCDCQG